MIKIIDIKNQFNINVIKILFVFVISLYILISFIHQRELDCTSQLLKGQLFNPNNADDLTKSKTCALKEYTPIDYEECLHIQGKPAFNITFVGSKIMDEFYSYFRTKFEISSNDIFDGSKADARERSSAIEYSNFDLNSNIVLYKHFRYVDDSFSHFIKTWPKSELPEVIVMGFNPFNYNRNEFNSYINNVSDLSFQLDVLGESTTLFWIVPYFKAIEMKSRYFERHKGSVNRALKASHVKLWEFYPDEESSPNQNEKLSQVILNYLCNNKLEPNSTSLCCSGLERKVKFERRLEIYITFTNIIMGLFMVYAYFKRASIYDFINTKFNIPSLRKTSLDSEDAISEDLLKIDENNKVSVVISEKGPNEKKYDFNFCIRFIMKCILIFSYFYICDRTKLFDKKYKEFHAGSFYIPLFTFLVASFAFREKCSSTKPLNREITEEWKGWMQIVILIYHITGASSQIPIYMHIRILVSAYLFMTGFGNFCYYWQGGELTFRRYCQVMLRMNLLTIMLCVVMNEYYQFYYFVPLVSFWYTFLFILLLLPPKLSSINSEGKPAPSKADYVVTLVKFILCAAAITVLGWSKKIFDDLFLFPLWRLLFILPGREDEEWWFRWNLDKYSVLYGAVFGLLYKGTTHLAKYFETKGDTKKKCFTITLLTCGILCSSSYIILTSQCFSKQQCNNIHPYVVWIPILGFVVVRNLTELWRGYCSTIMLSAGKISLELFICQYHIWLAGNTKGSLILIPWGHPALNYLIVTLIFVWIAQEVHSMTGDLVYLVTPKDNKKIFINLVAMLTVFFAISLILR